MKARKEHGIHGVKFNFGAHNLTLNREPQNSTLHLFYAGFTLHPARISCGCLAVHTLTGTRFCTITSCIKLVPFRHLVRIPDEVCLIRRDRLDNKQS